MLPEGDKPYTRPAGVVAASAAPATKVASADDDGFGGFPHPATTGPAARFNGLYASVPLAPLIITSPPHAAPPEPGTLPVGMNEIAVKRLASGYTSEMTTSWAEHTPDAPSPASSTMMDRFDTRTATVYFGFHAPASKNPRLIAGGFFMRA
jgi:hypothetical protein